MTVPDPKDVRRFNISSSLKSSKDTRLELGGNSYAILGPTERSLFINGDT